MRPLVSVVCPVYNEEEGIVEFYNRLSAAMQKSSAIRYEIIFVNDGSRDDTASVITKLAEADPALRLLMFSRNFGHQLAITAGIDYAVGDAVVVIDSDLQDPPEVILQMIDKWRDGADVVYGQRQTRAGESKFKLATARGFYRVINRLSDIELPLDAGDFRLMDRKVVDALKQIREENRYMRGLVAWVGFKQVALPYERDERFAGETKYPLSKMLHLATDGISSFSERPLKLAMHFGAFVTVAAFAMVLWIIITKLIDPSSQLPGYASMMAAIMFMGGLQLLAIGILGQYIGRTYREVKHRPLYIVADRMNFEHDLRDDVVDREVSLSGR